MAVLTDRARRFAVLVHQGKTGREAYIEAGYSNPTRQNISRIRRSVAVRRHLETLERQEAEIRADLRGEFRAYAAEAYRRLKDLAENGRSELVRLRALRDILDRAGYRAADAQPAQSRYQPLIVVRAVVNDGWEQARESPDEDVDGDSAGG